MAYIAWQKPAGPVRNIDLVGAEVLGFATVAALIALIRLIRIRWRKK
jgi:hypothetical protein